MTSPFLTRRRRARYAANVAAVVLLSSAAALVAGAQAPPLRTTGSPQVSPASASTAVATIDSLLPTWLLATLRASNPDLAARRVALTAAEARLGAAGFAPAAVLSAELEDAPRARLGEASIRLGVEREILTGRRRAAARAAAEADMRAAAAAVRVTEQRAAAVALRALVQTVGWRAVAGRLASQDSLLASAEGSLRARFGVGDARYVDVLRLRTERLRVQTERSGSLTEARAGAFALVSLLGGTSDAPGGVSVANVARLDSLVSVGQTPFVRGELPPAPDVDSLLAGSGLVALADAEVTQSAALRQLLIAMQRPQVSAGIGLQRVGAEGNGDLGPTVGVSVSLPFTARRANAAALSAADRGVEAAVAGRRATLAAVRGALGAARDRYEAARARLAVFDAALLRGARDERESALAAYRTADLSLLELVDFERALSNAEIERTRALVDAAGALADLFAGAAGAIESLQADLPPTVQVTSER